MLQNISICWFRQDLRIQDNPALSAAIQQGKVLAIYILDDDNAAEAAMGAASRWWLHHSLQSLNQSLQGKLNIYKGDAKTIIAELTQRFAVQEMHWNRCYEPWRIHRDTAIKKQLSTDGFIAKSHSGALLHEPWAVHKKDGTHYQVFTPYYKTLNTLAEPNSPLEIHSTTLYSALLRDQNSLSIDQLELLPTVKWDTGIAEVWQPGEAQALMRLQQFLTNGIDNYKEGRDFPAKNSVSKLSPYLHFGELSARQIWWALKEMPENENTEHFRRELCWREFSYYLLFHLPHLPIQNLRPAFDDFAWEANTSLLKKWQQGKTGYPIVDAGMRELWQTGYMHNRVRMICASFLVKNLLIDWRHGAEWFWNCLVDADLANNSASWQWVAGCGADAAPYFRIFNPTTQAEKFDPLGDYIKTFLPELEKLPVKYLFTPSEAPTSVLKQAGILLGQDYPSPIVDLKISRQKALDAYAQIKKSS